MFYDVRNFSISFDIGTWTDEFDVWPWDKAR